MREGGKKAVRKEGDMNGLYGRQGKEKEKWAMEKPKGGKKASWREREKWAEK